MPRGYNYPVHFYIPTGYAKTISGLDLECPPKILTRYCEFEDLSGALTVTGDSETGNWDARIHVIGIPIEADHGQLVADYRSKRLYTIDRIQRTSNPRLHTVLMFDSDIPYEEPIFLPEHSMMFLCETVSFNDQLVTFTPTPQSF